MFGLGPALTEVNVLEKLAEKFDRITVLDLDTETVRAAIGKLPGGLQNKFQIEEQELTGAGKSFTAAVDAALQSSASAEEAMKKNHGRH